MELFTPGHLLIVAIVAFVLFFGWKQLPDMSRSLGRSLRVFKTEIKGLSEDDKAREQAREEQTAEPKALEAPRAEFVKPSTATPVTPPSNGDATVDGVGQSARTRPRPAPGPRA